MSSCSKCGINNASGTQFCSNCGKAFGNFNKQVKPKNKNNLIITLVVLSCVLGSCVLLGLIGTIRSFINPSNNTSNTKIQTNTNQESSNSQEILIIDSSVEFILDLSEEEKLKRFKEIKTFPQFAKLSETVKSLGYIGCNSYRSNTNRNEPVKDNLTGLLFGCDEDYKKYVKGQEYKLIVLGQSKDSIDTIRLQTFGVFTKEARDQLIRDASLVLDKINKGKIPIEFSKDFYAGKQMGDGKGISNGFCIIQALQMPINGQKSTENDRISLDLIFDKQK